MTSSPLTDQQLADIETRAARLYEYDVRQSAEADVLAGTDVPALVAEVHRLRAQVAELERAANCQSRAAIDSARCSLPVRHRGDHQTADRRHYWSDEHALPAEEAHVVADDSDTPDTGTRQCGHDDYHDAHEWADRPGVWCPGYSHADDEPAPVRP